MGLLSQPQIKPAQKVVPPTNPVPQGGGISLGGMNFNVNMSTPQVTNKGSVDILKDAGSFLKQVATGDDTTDGGVVRNTIEGLPKALASTGIGLLSSLKEQFVNPSDEQKKYEDTMLPYGSTPATKVLTAPGVAAARLITRFINPGLQPVANDLAEIRAINEKGGIADQITAGKIPASVLNEFAVLHKTSPQVVGDVAQAVLTAFAGSEAPETIGETKSLGLKDALKTGFSKALPVGELFGGAQAASSGSTNPLEIAGTIGTSGVAGGLFGAIISGAIPVSKEVFKQVEKAKAVYDAMTPEQKQGGFIKNPFESFMIKDRVSEELHNLDTKPLTVNGGPDLSNADTQFRLSQLQDTVNKRALTTAETMEAAGLLKTMGIDVKPNMKAGFAKNPLAKSSTKSSVHEEGGTEYPTIHEGGVVKMVKGEPVKIVDGVNTFVHKGDGGWVVSESSTGRFLAESASKEGAIAKASFNIENIGKEKFLELLDTHKKTFEKDPTPLQKTVPLEPGGLLSREILDKGPLETEKISQKQSPQSKEGGGIPESDSDVLNDSYKDSVPQDFNPGKYVEEQVKDRESARAVGAPTLLDKTKSFLSNAKTKLVDFTSPIEDILSDTVKKHDLKIEPKDDIHNQIDRVLRAPTLAGQFAEDHGMVDVIKKVDNVDALDQYLIAKHAVELDTRGIETGRDIAKDQALVKAYGPKYEPYAKTVSEYSRKLLDYSVETGLISEDLANTLKKRYPDYVPFQRVFNELEETQGRSGNGKAVASISKQNVIQKIEGSKRAIESPIESLLAKTHDAFKQGEKNVAGKMLASYEKLPGNPFELKDITGEEIGNRSTISFFEDGKKHVFETTPEIAEAAKALNVQQLNVLGQILAYPVRLARVGITGINLPFVGANIAKDAITAFINSDKGLQTSVANPVNFVKALFSAVGHDDLYKEMVREGGAGTSFDISRDQAKSTVESIRADRNVGSKIKYTVLHPSELLRTVEDIIGRSEEFTRIQQYRGTKEAMLKEGATAENARAGGARQARDATVNFARRGEWGSVLNSAFLYLNAGIQGTRSLLRNLKDKPVQTASKIVISAMLPVAAATTWNMSDPKRKAAYDDISEYEKENNIIIVPPNPTQDEEGRWNVIKIPLSQEIDKLVGIPRKAIEMAYGADPLTFGDFADALLGTVSPIAPDKGSILSTITPQAIKPTIEATTNTNLFTGIPEVPRGMQDLSPEKQVKDYTSGTAIEIGNKLGVSPIKVEAFIKETFGGVGSQALNVIDRVQNALGADVQVGGQDVLDAIGARFNKAQGGKKDDAAISEVQDLLRKQADNSSDTKKKAQTLDEELQKLSPSEANAKYAEIKKSDPAVAAKLRDVVEERKLGLSYEEKLMKDLGVANGERAKYVDQQIMKLPEDQRNNYFNDLVNKKIISPEVRAQIKKLRTQSTQVSEDKKPVSFIDQAKEGLSNVFGAKTALADDEIPKQKAEDQGLISVPKKWNYAMQDVYNRYPDVPKGMVESVLMMESSMGSDTTNKNKDFGQFGYLGGHTNNGAFKSLLDMAKKDPKLEAKIKVLEKDKEGKYSITNIKNLGDEYSAIQATGSTLAALMRNNPGTNLQDLYFKKYVTDKKSDSPARRALFTKALQFYASQ